MLFERDELVMTRMKIEKMIAEKSGDVICCFRYRTASSRFRSEWKALKGRVWVIRPAEGPLAVALQQSLQWR